jgi:hypothetical protein
MKELVAWVDTIDPATIPDEVLKFERARRNSLKRKKFGAGPGRPRKYPLKVVVAAQAPEAAPASRTEPRPSRQGENQPVTALCPLCGWARGSNALACFECQTARAASCGF